MSCTRWFWQFYYIILCCTLEFWGFTSDWHPLFQIPNSSPVQSCKDQGLDQKLQTRLKSRIFQKSFFFYDTKAFGTCWYFRGVGAFFHLVSTWTGGVCLGGLNRLQAPVGDRGSKKQCLVKLRAPAACLKKGNFWGGVGGGGVIIVCSGLISDIIQYCLCSP